jgi:hypothetical protein
MKRKPYVGLDGHCSFTEPAVVTESGRLGQAAALGHDHPRADRGLGDGAAAAVPE